LLNPEVTKDEETKKYNEMTEQELTIPIEKATDYIDKELNALKAKIDIINKKTSDKVKLALPNPLAKEEKVWSAKKRKEMKNAFFTFSGELRDVSNLTIVCKSSDFFSQIAARLLELDLEIDRNLENAFGEILKNALENYTNISKDPEMLPYWRINVRAMLMLGASPISWIDEQIIPRRLNSKEIIPSVLQASLLVAHLARITMAHLQAHSTHYGEALSLFRASLDNFIRATHVFAVALYNTCENPNWVFSLLSLVHLRNIPLEARNIRVKLFWSTMQLCHLLLNNIDTDNATNSAKIMLAINNFETFKNEYNLTVTKSYWLSNTGFREFNQLLADFNKVIKNVKTLNKLRNISSFIENSQVVTQRVEAAESERDASNQARDAAEQKARDLQDATIELLRDSLTDKLELALTKLGETPTNEQLSNMMKTITDNFSKSKKLSICEVQLLLIEVITANTQLNSLRPLIDTNVTVANEQNGFFYHSANELPRVASESATPAP
jgi:hypothetical protein